MTLISRKEGTPLVQDDPLADDLASALWEFTAHQDQGSPGEAHSGEETEEEEEVVTPGEETEFNLAPLAHPTIAMLTGKNRGDDTTEVEVVA